MTATNTWYAWYAEYEWSGPPYGAPMPGDAYAYVGSDATDVLLTWTAAQGALALTNYLVLRGVLDTNTGDYVYSQIATLNTNTTTFQDVGAIQNSNDWNDVYEVEAVYPGNGVSQPAEAYVTTTPPPPTGASATVDSTGTNVLISWTPPQGVTVSNYVILRGIYDTNSGNYDYSQIGQVDAGTTTFEDVGAITGNNSYNNVYEIEAVYPDGSTSYNDYASLPSPPSPPPASYDNIYITAYLVRNGTGRWQVMFSGFPTNSVQTIQLTWTDGNGNTNVQSISTGTLTNGIYSVPDSDAVNFMGDSLSVQLFGPEGEPGQVAQAGVLASDAPYFVDGRQHMKQNLNFLIRAASLYQPFNVYLTPAAVVYQAGDTTLVIVWVEYQGRFNQTATNFAQFGFLYDGPGLDNLWPFTANYQMANCFVDTTRTNLYQLPYGTNQFVFQPNFATNIPAPPVLAHADPYWILQPLFDPWYSPNYDVYPNTTNWGVSVVSFTNGGPMTVSLPNGLNNVFGLPEQAGCAVDGVPAEAWFPGGFLYPIISCIYQILEPGSSVTTEDPGNHEIEFYASWCPAPTLNFVNYYFAPLINPNLNVTNLPPVSQQPFPLPVDDAFNITNQTPPVIVGSVGQPMILGGWAKYSIQGSSPTKYAYLGQYFMTNAFLLNTSGNATTNVAGILSPYGEFFPLQAGAAALVTLPDIDPPYQQGTGVVQIISMNVDANHDGFMDFSYFGPDQTSPSRPFRFWINDDTDSRDYGGNGIPGQGINGDAVWPTFGTDYRSFELYAVHGTRDLVDFFPVYLNIGSLVRALPPSNTVRYVLKQADNAVNFTYTDLTPTNYMNFLRDTQEAEKLTTNKAMIVTADGYVLDNNFIQQIATNNQGIILVEGRTNTTQPLVLEVWQGSSLGSDPFFWHPTNMLAQTKLYLSLSGVEQMFRHKSLMLNPNIPVLPDRLTDASVPNEPDTIDKNFVFLHGYNVLPNEARGVAADMFKRMYWSGSHAKFYAVTWQGADTKGTYPFYNLLTPNYHTNVGNAFLTAPNLANFIATLANTGPVVLTAHSLGNMVTLSAINDWNAPISQYLMLDAAVPIEAIDPTAITNMMIYSTWTGYSNRLYASDWWQLFPANDARSTLSWNNRLGNSGSTIVYNFYSSGEEVLREYDADPPTSVRDKVLTQITDFWNGIPFGTYTWYWQEKGKGTCSQDWFLGSSHGGWKFNTNAPYAYVTNGVITQIPNSQATLIPNSQLKTNAFFNFTSSTITADSALLGSGGSTYANANRNRILSDAIPALSLVAGANLVPRFQASGRNFDMQTFENGWPQGRLNSREANNWHHSDFHEVAYTFTYKLFNQFVTLGNLK